MIHMVDSKTLGNKNYILLESYLRWVRARAQSIMMPYPSVLPMIVESVAKRDTPYLIHHPDMPTYHEELQKSWVQLKEERDTFEVQFYASEKKVMELTRILCEERNINAYIAPKRMRSWET